MSPSSQYAELMSQNATALKEAQGNIEEGFLKAFETLKYFQKKHATLKAEEKKLQDGVLETQVMEDADLIAREKALDRRETNLKKSEEDLEKRKKQLEMREQAVEERETDLLIREERIKKLNTTIKAAIGAYQQTKITKKEDEDSLNVTPRALDTSASTSSVDPQKMSGEAQDTSTILPTASSLPISKTPPRKVVIVRRRNQEVARMTTGSYRSLSPASRARMDSYEYISESGSDGDESDRSETDVDGSDDRKTAAIWTGPGTSLDHSSTISSQAFPQGYAIHCPVVGTTTAQIQDSVEEESPIQTTEHSTRGHAPCPSITVSGAMMERMSSDGTVEHVSDLEKEYRSREMLD